MSETITMRAGEATVFADSGQPTDAMPEILIGDINGPVGQAFANMMAQSAGHTNMFAVRACNHMVRPPTMLASKVTIKNSAYVNLYGGTVQSAISDAIVDSVSDGVIPKDQVNDLCIICLVWIDPSLPKVENIDHDDLYKNNYDATKLAVSRAMNNEPSIDDLISQRDTVKHEMYNPGNSGS